MATFLATYPSEVPAYAMKEAVAILLRREEPDKAKLGRIVYDIQGYAMLSVLGDVDDADPSPVVPIGAAPERFGHLSDEGLCATISERLDAMSGPQPVGASVDFRSIFAGIAAELVKRLLLRVPDLLDIIIPKS